MSGCDTKYDGDRRHNYYSLVRMVIALIAATSCSVNINVTAESDLSSSSSAVLYQPSELLDATAVKRRESEVADEIGSLVPASDRALRNSYVRFGRSSGKALGSNEILSYLAAASAEAERKRAKHYVRYGRDGRHYVRYGRSFPSSMAADDCDDDEAEVENAYVKRTPEKTYVRFGRSAVDADALPFVGFDNAPSRRKRASGSGGRQYVRYGRNNALGEADDVRVARGGSQAQGAGAAKHYVRFGRTSSGAKTDDVDDFRFNSDVEGSERMEEKRSGTGGASKHYVRFGRTPEANMAESDTALEEADEKRSKHYVRFGRAGDVEQTVEEGKSDGAASDKRSPNYVRFG